MIIPKRVPLMARRLAYSPIFARAAECRYISQTVNTRQEADWWRTAAPTLLAPLPSSSTSGLQRDLRRPMFPPLPHAARQEACGSPNALVAGGGRCGQSTWRPVLVGRHLPLTQIIVPAALIAWIRQPLADSASPLPLGRQTRAWRGRRLDSLGGGGLLRAGDSCPGGRR